MNSPEINSSSTINVLLLLQLVCSQLQYHNCYSCSSYRRYILCINYTGGLFCIQFIIQFIMYSALKNINIIRSYNVRWNPSLHLQYLLESIINKLYETHTYAPTDIYIYIYLSVIPIVLISSNDHISYCIAHKNILTVYCVHFCSKEE